MGTVLDDGESPHTTRALEAAGHAAAVFRHFAVSHGQLDDAERTEYLAAFSDSSQGHLVSVNRWDKPYVTGGLIAELGLAQTASGWVDQLVAAESAGATEVAYQPVGPDIPRELETFARAHAMYVASVKA